MTRPVEDIKRKYAQLLENSYESTIEWIDMRLENFYIFEDRVPYRATYFQIMSKDSEKVVKHYTKKGYTCQVLPIPDSPRGDIMKTNDQLEIVISW